MKHHPHNCPTAEAHELRTHGCGCDGAYDDGCPMCTNNYHTLFCEECTWELPDYPVNELLANALMALKACEPLLSLPPESVIIGNYVRQQDQAKRFDAEEWELKKIEEQRNVYLEKCYSRSTESLIKALNDLCQEFSNDVTMRNL